MGAAAEFHRVAVELKRCAADLDNADGVAVLVTEELEDAGASLDFCKGNLLPAYGGILKDTLVDEMLHRGDLLRSEGGAGEIEAEFFGADK